MKNKISNIANSLYFIGIFLVIGGLVGAQVQHDIPETLKVWIVVVATGFISVIYASILGEHKDKRGAGHAASAQDFLEEDSLFKISQKTSGNTALVKIYPNDNSYYLFFLTAKLTQLKEDRWYKYDKKNNLYMEISLPEIQESEKLTTQLA